CGSGGGTAGAGYAVDFRAVPGGCKLLAVLCRRCRGRGRSRGSGPAARVEQSDLERRLVLWPRNRELLENMPPQDAPGVQAREEGCSEGEKGRRLSDAFLTEKVCLWRRPWIRLRVQFPLSDRHGGRRMLTDYLVHCPHAGCNWHGSLFPKGNREAWRPAAP